MVDENTEDLVLNVNNPQDANSRGIIKGFDKQAGQSVTIDQGLNTTAISFKFALDPDLLENRYIVEIDNRLGAITDDAGNIKSPNFIDDDNIASYTFTLGSDPQMVNQMGNAQNDSIISGPRGSRLMFSIAASIELNSSTYLFTKIGSSGGTFLAADGSTSLGAGSETVYQIDSIVKVTGGSTGRSLDIPVRFLKVK